MVFTIDVVLSKSDLQIAVNFLNSHLQSNAVLSKAYLQRTDPQSGTAKNDLR